jgi:hypothetical protein
MMKNIIWMEYRFCSRICMSWGSCSTSYYMEVVKWRFSHTQTQPIQQQKCLSLTHVNHATSCSSNCKSLFPFRFLFNSISCMTHVSHLNNPPTNLNTRIWHIETQKYVDKFYLNSIAKMLILFGRIFLRKFEHDFIVVTRMSLSQLIKIFYYICTLFGLMECNGMERSRMT